MKTLAERLSLALANSDKKQSELAAACGVKAPSVSDWFSGESKTMKAATALRAAEFLGVNFLWLTEGRGPMRPSGGIKEVPHAKILQAIKELPSDEYQIPRYDENMRARGGSNGLSAPYEYIVGHVSVTLDWLRTSLPAITRKENLRVIEAYGPSMEPTIIDGALLLVDTGVTKVTRDAEIFIIERNNTHEPELMVKRINRRHDGGIILRSDNTALVDPEPIPLEKMASVRVLGRVVYIWAGRKP